MLRRTFLCGLVGATACSRPSDATTSAISASASLSGDGANREALAALRAEYRTNVGDLDAARRSLGKRWRAAGPVQEKQLIEAEGRSALLRALDTELFPAWLGTPWDYNGTTETPGEGKIACGYLVTTLLRDTGVKLQRVRLAQQVSEHIVKALCRTEDISRYRRGDVAAVVRATHDKGDGLYVVGLDHHVGLLRVRAADVRFWHTSFVAVVDEKASDAPGFVSNYHVVGKLFGEMSGWLS